MKYKSYQQERSFRRPDRYDPSKDYAIATFMLAVVLMGAAALGFLIAFTKGG